MSQVRAAAVAGQFYPADAIQLQQDVDSMLSQACTAAPCPKALVAPHAGFIYSGSIAAEVYARVKNGAGQISRVILLGPSHRVGFEGIATTTADFYTTPLGQIPLDKAAIGELQQLPGVVSLDQAHAQEHSLEVHLPFLQRCLPGFTLVPLVVGQSSPAMVAQVIDKLWGGPETLIVISSDLSHHLPYEDANKKDSQTTQLIEDRSPNITGDQACGCQPLNGLLQVLRQRQLGIETVQVKNSGDTAGSRDRVVGYGAWVVDESVKESAEETNVQSQTISTAQRQQLLYLARAMILHGLEGGGEYNIALKNYHPSLREERGCFVTLNRNGRLRGCIGSLAATRALVIDVAHNANAAAFKDSRFKPLQMQEYPEIELHISVLSPSTVLAVDSRETLLEKLRPGVDGLILQQGKHRSTYLPSVWAQICEPENFVSELRKKAGLPAAGWSKDMQVWTYTTEEFS
jgi:AmmeMemoRadiSam system protein B/AmmeMemoRadiSam system protein A